MNRDRKWYIDTCIEVIQSCEFFDGDKDDIVLSDFIREHSITEQEWVAIYHRLMA